MSAGVAQPGFVDPKRLIDEALTKQIIGAAIEVHRHLGPGLLESAYEECLCHELQLRSLTFKRQVNLPVVYKNVALDCGYKMDLIVEDRVVVELKCVESVLGVHHRTTAHLSEAQRKTSRPPSEFPCLDHDKGHCPEGVVTFLCLSPCLRVSVVN